MSNTQLPYLIVRIGSVQLAISSQFIAELFLAPNATPIPGQRPGIRGVANVRGQILGLVDLRVCCGMPSFLQDTKEEIATLEQREQDHRNWLRELQASVREKRPFALARDPHQCKFGRWYDVYQPMNRSMRFMLLWRSFDTPHCRIHAIADAVCDLAGKGEHEKALAIIAAAEKTDLGELVGLFASARTVLHETTREVAMILEDQGYRMAISVDEVLEMHRVAEGDLVPLPVEDAAVRALFASKAIAKPQSKSVWPILAVDRIIRPSVAA